MNLEQDLQVTRDKPARAGRLAPLVRNCPMLRFLRQTTKSLKEFFSQKAQMSMSRLQTTKIVVFPTIGLIR